MAKSNRTLLRALTIALLMGAISNAVKAASYESTNQGQMSPELRQWSDSNIAEHRVAEITLTINDSDGEPLKNAKIRVRQVKKSFCFGSALNEWVIDGNPDFKASDPIKFREWFEKHFNCGTPASTLHWKLMESERDVDGVGVWYADGTINWMQERDMQALGHAVTWENPDLVPDWVKAAPNSQALKSLLTARIERLVGRYDGKINHWVGINEMLDYDSISAKFDNNDFKFRPWLYSQLKKYKPSLKLLVNEAGILAEPGKVEQYKNLISQLQADGAPIDIIGIQAHFWPNDQEYLNLEIIKQRLDSLAELGLPIWITEFDYAHADEHVRANQLEGFYRLAYAHPAVEAIKVWGYWEGAHWRSDWGTPVALVEQDWRVAKSGERLGQLMNEWNTTLSGQTDAQGQIIAKGFLGDYIVDVQSANGNNFSHAFSLTKNTPDVMELQP